MTNRGLVYRHDPASGRDPELRSCPGSLKPVTVPDGELLLFVDTAAAADLGVSAPPGLF